MQPKSAGEASPETSQRQNAEDQARRRSVQASANFFLQSGGAQIKMAKKPALPSFGEDSFGFDEGEEEEEEEEEEETRCAACARPISRLAACSHRGPAASQGTGGAVITRDTRLRRRPRPALVHPQAQARRLPSPATAASALGVLPGRCAAGRGGASWAVG